MRPEKIISGNTTADAAVVRYQRYRCAPVRRLKSETTKVFYLNRLP